KKNKKGKNTRTSIMVASLNMRGHGTLGPDDTNNKWMLINQLMRTNRIGILAIQEAHLTEEFAEQINDLFERRLSVIWSQGDNSRAKGIAFVINREIMSADHNIKVDDIVPGRVAMLSIQWHNNLKLKILNVYAPNGATENGAFWSEIQNTLEEKDLPKPDMMLGDHNTVEDSIDRLPNRSDSATTVDPLRELQTKLGLIDGWRTTNPTDKAFTWTNGRSHSRIDRIYVSRTIHNTAVDWDITEAPGLETDHKIVSVRITNPQMPHIGTGRWTIPELLLKSKKLSKSVIALGKKMIQEIGSIQTRTDEKNPQIIFEKFKAEVIAKARTTAKIEIPKLKKRTDDMKKDLKATLNARNTPEAKTIADAGVLQKQITALENLRHASIRMATKARDAMEGETISKYWSSVN
ncbi:DNase I-like protein, partial [Athelia psychrophila]